MKDVVLTIHRCDICSREIIRSLSHTRTIATTQRCCHAQAIAINEVVAPTTKLGGFMLGEPVEADVFRGPFSRNDGQRYGSNVVTKKGVVDSITVTGPYTDIYVRFDDGDFQSCPLKTLDGREPSHPCAALRRRRNAA